MFSSRSLSCGRAMNAFSRFLFTHNNTLGFGLLFPLYIYCRSIYVCHSFVFFSFEFFQRSFRRPIRIVVANRMHFDWKHNFDQVITKWIICKMFWMHFDTDTWDVAVECASIDCFESERMIYKRARVVMVWQSSVAMSQASKPYMFLTPFGQIRFRKYGRD